MNLNLMNLLEVSLGSQIMGYMKDDEIIEIKHEALSRKIFSDGSVKAINYLKDKKSGMYTMKDVLGIKYF